MGRLPGRRLHARARRPRPGPYAWPRLLALWVPAGARRVRPRVSRPVALGPAGRSARHYLADQATAWSWCSLLGVGLWLLGPARPVAARDRGLAHALRRRQGGDPRGRALWRWLGERPGPAARGRASASSSGAFLPVPVPRRAHVTTAMSGTSDEPYYLLVAHSLLTTATWTSRTTSGASDYLPFYWGTLTSEAAGVLADARGPRCSPACIRDSSRSADAGLRGGGPPRRGRHDERPRRPRAWLLAFRLARASGASRRAAFLAWSGRAFSAPVRGLRDLARSRDHGRVPGGRRRRMLLWQPAGDGRAAVAAAAVPRWAWSRSRLGPVRDWRRRSCWASLASASRWRRVAMIAGVLVAGTGRPPRPTTRRPRRAHQVADSGSENALARSSAGSSTGRSARPFEHRGSSASSWTRSSGSCASRAGVRARPGRQRGPGRPAPVAAPPPAGRALPASPVATTSAPWPSWASCRGGMS